MSAYFLLMQPLGTSASSSNSTVQDEDGSNQTEKAVGPKHRGLQTSPRRECLLMGQRAMAGTHTHIHTHAWAHTRQLLLSDSSTHSAANIY